MHNKPAYIIVVILALLLAACGTVATPVWEQPESTATNEAESSAVVPTKSSVESAAPTATDVPATSTPVPPTGTFTPEPPTAIPTLAPSTTVAAAPASNDPIVFFVSQSNAEHGKELFNTFFDQAGYMCATCHNVDSKDRKIGPGLLNIGTVNEQVNPGMPNEVPERYIYESITNPSAYVVPEYPDNLMPKVWAQVFGEQDIYDIIAYLMTLK